MSDELADEIEAINSIYGPETLQRAEDDDEEHDKDDDDDDGGDGGGGVGGGVGALHVLRLPGGASWLRLRFPAAYPREAPAAVGTQRSSGGMRGAGARDLQLFGEVLGDVFAPGAVCVFDAVEEFAARAAALRAGADGGGVRPGADERGASLDGDATAQARGEPGPSTAAATPALTPDPALDSDAWTASAPVTENKSTFVARAARAATPAQARALVAQLLASERRLRTATHNMTAWRVRGDARGGAGAAGAAGAGMHDCDDGGEARAGARLLRLLHLMGVWDAVVVVSRWHGGVRLGPRRFALVAAVARDALVRAGFAAADGRAGGGGRRGRRAR